jgi:mono/diheme cytochrome c family protein
VGIDQRTFARRALSAVMVLATTGLLAHAQSPRTVRDGVFTAAQAERGRAVYAARCASCHGDALQGVSGPPLVGDAFVSRWQSDSLGALLTKISKTMPADAPGELTPQQSADVLAHILKSGGFPAGTRELAGTLEAANQIGWPPVSGAGAQAAPPAVSAHVYPPVGNVAQLMRGIFFPNSNLIFTVQTHDPGEKPAPQSSDAQANGFSWATWGAGIYTGWQVVDNAAVALADASPLLLTPGLRCENGRLAPVTDPDWIKFTERMIDVAKQTYKASQTRNQEAVSDATGDLSDACAACHQAYRDVRVPGRRPDPTSPAGNGARCMQRSTAK